MATGTAIIRNFYRDSVALMRLSSQIAERPEIHQASAVMATEANQALLREAGLLVEGVAAGPNDLLVVVDGQGDAAVAEALQAARSALDQKPAQQGGAGRSDPPPRSLQMGLEKAPDANLAIISTPGAYAASEAFKALRLGLNVMLFSDNVEDDDELALKQFARERQLLVMGPDCGTAILNGVPLGFANVVRRGAIGVVAASGTGAQLVTCLIDRYGEGVSQAIGTGGHDLSRKIGGITALQGLEALGEDDATKVVVLISKPPAAEVAERALDRASALGKPVVVCFLGAAPGSVARPNVTAARTLEEAARLAVGLAGGRAPPLASPLWPSERPRLAAEQKYVRGLYSGGTFCFEAALLLGECASPVFTNTPVGAAAPLPDIWKSQGHTLIDLGDDVFTRGRPHPMIDHRLRNERIVKEAADPETAVIVLDVVLGYGSNANPAGEIVPAIAAARAQAAQSGRQIAFVGFVCGVERDPQVLSKQEAALGEAGVILAQSSAQAIAVAAELVGATSKKGRNAK
jgi:FdrA protein